MSELTKSLLEETSETLKGIMIPAQPELISEVLSAKPDLYAISQIIQRDPALYASIFRLLDRTFSKRHRQLSIEDAVHALGVDRITMMINAILLHSASRFEFDGEALEYFWKSSQQVAEISAVIAHHLNLNLVDEAYCVGIFHHIGMPLLWQKHPNYFDSIQGFGGERLIQLENTLYSRDHATVGYYIASSVQLDPSVCDAIRFHHTCLTVFFHQCRCSKMTYILLSILKMAEHIAGENARLCDEYHSLEWDEIRDVVLDNLGLGRRDCEEFEDRILSAPPIITNKGIQEMVH